MRITERDAGVLRRIGEQYILRTDDFASYAKTGKTRSLQLLRRYRQAGLIESGRILFGEPAYHWLTAQGLREVALPFRPLRPAALLLRHHHEVNRVRLSIENNAEYGGTRWVSERWLRYKERSSAHIPDAVVEFDRGAYGNSAKKVAIEIELTQKEAERQKEIGEQLALWDELWLFVAPGVKCIYLDYVPGKLEVIQP